MNKKRGGGVKPTRKTGAAGRTKTTTRSKTAGAQSRSAAGQEDEKKTVSSRDKRKYIDFKQKQKKGDPMPKFDEDAIRLNKYLSNAGICSRREADVFIANGIVSVNGEIITEMGYKVKSTDIVKYGDDSVRSATKRYVILNKPKGFITTLDDETGRKTVMTLVKKATREQLYPVGRMEKDATGLMFFTNDGDMMKKLTHPQYKAKKIYHLELDKPVKKEDLERLTSGIDLEDGKVLFDKAEYVKGDSREIGLELTSGKNSIARRALESMGYVVIKVDRVQYAGLTKKDLPRGHYRVLTEKEVNFIKMS
jgi:23S rRNA pseudouridine2605 synthase